MELAATQHETPSPAIGRPLPTVSLRRGLWRYRTDRMGLLCDLARDGHDMVESRLGPLRLAMVTDADLARAVLVENDDAFRKGPAIARHARPLLGDGLLSNQGEDHRRQRKVLAPRFRPRHIVGLLDTMVAITERTLTRWRETPPTDFAEEMSQLAIEIATQTMFGTQVTEHIPLIREVLEIGQRYLMAESTSIVHLPLSWPTARNRELTQAVAALDELVYRLIAERRAAGADANASDMLGALLDAQRENQVSDDRVRDEVVTFLMAGHETTATALSWCYVHLAEAPELAARLAREADQVLGAGASIQDTVRGLEFAGQVLRETLRLAPPLYMVGRQALRDVDIGPYALRSGTYVLVNVLGMHRRDDYFADPHAFRPERFAGTPSWPRHAYLPFGAGPRVCIGNHFATMGGTLVLAHLARAIEFRKDWERIAPDPMLTLRPAGRIPFNLQWRNV